MDLYRGTNSRMQPPMRSVLLYSTQTYLKCAYQLLMPRAGNPYGADTASIAIHVAKALQSIRDSPFQPIAKGVSADSKWTTPRSPSHANRTADDPLRGATEHPNVSREQPQGPQSSRSAPNAQRPPMSSPGGRSPHSCIDCSVPIASTITCTVCAGKLNCCSSD